MKNTEDYKSEQEYEEIFEDRIKQLNKYYNLLEDGYEFDIDYAYGGARLVKRKKDTSAERDLSVRFYYDEDGAADYDAFMEMLNTIINVMREIEKNVRD